MARAHAPQRPPFVVGETRNCIVSFAGRLESGEVLTGTPTVTEETTSDLTISNVAVNTSLRADVNGEDVAIGHGVQFTVSGHSAGVRYALLLTAATDASPPQTLKARVKFHSGS